MSTESTFYRAVSLVIMVLTAPLWVPLAIYIGLTYHWEDTVPSDEDLNYEE
jgi:hypothetical protein